MEVELKIAVPKDQIAAVLYKMELANLSYKSGYGELRPFKGFKKEDVYYSVYDSLEEGKKHSEPLIRLRTEQSSTVDCLEEIDAFVKDGQTMFGAPETEHFLTVKNKSNKDGFEANEELEVLLGVDGKQALEAVLSNGNYKPVWSKEKVGLNFLMNNQVNVDIVKIKDCFWVEMEYICDGESRSRAMKAIESSIDSLGLSIFNKDNRSWPEIHASMNSKD